MAEETKIQNLAVANKLPPQNNEAEMSLLGSLMLDKDAIVKVADFLEPRDFYKDSHREIYNSMVDLFEKSEPIDLLSVSIRLKERKKLDAVGGHTYLTELVNVVPTASHVLGYAKTVKNKRVLRDLISASHEIGLMGFNEVEETDVLLDRAEASIFQIAQNILSRNFIRIKDLLGETFERIDRLSKNQGGFRGVPTGFKDLDNILSGLQKSDLIILAARPSLGKSSLALDIARSVAVNEKIPVGVFSLEMSKDQVMDRFIAAQAKVDLWKLRTGKLSHQGENNDFERIQKAMGDLDSAPIYIDDSTLPNILQMRTMARRLQATSGLGLIIVDYLQLMEPRNSQSSSVQQITEISRALKGLARELNIPVLAVSQLSRAVEQRSPQRPRLSDLRESGSIEQDADVVLLIYRDDKTNIDSLDPNIAEIIIAKHRNGPIGSVKMYFNEKIASFSDLAQDTGYNPEGES